MTMPSRGARTLRAAFTYYQKIQCVLVALIFLITAACVMPPPATRYAITQPWFRQRSCHWACQLLCRRGMV